MPPPLLQLKDIALTFGGTPLLTGAELSVSTGERPPTPAGADVPRLYPVPQTVVAAALSWRGGDHWRRSTIAQ